MANLWGDGRKNVIDLPAAWWDWGSLIETFNRDDTTPLNDWLGVIDAFVKLQLGKPEKLALSSITLIQSSFPDGPLKEAALQIWKAASLLRTDLSSSALMVMNGSTDDAENLIGRLRRAFLCKRASTPDVRSAIRSSSKPKGFSKLGPSAKLKIL